MRAPTDPGFHRWRLELGGRPGCRLRLAKAGSEEARPPTVLASQSTTYDFSLRGVELTVKLNVEAHREPLRKVTLGLDPSLELVEVSTGDVPLAWNVVGKSRRQGPASNDRTPAVAADRRGEVAAAAIAPLSTAGVVETAAHHRRGRRLPVEHDSPLGPVAAVHRAPGNPRVPADRRGCLEDFRGRATGLRSLRGRRRSRCFPCATSHGGAGRQRHGDPLGPRQDEQPRGDRLPHRRGPRLLARSRRAAQLDDRLGRIPADGRAGRLDAGAPRRRGKSCRFAWPGR